MIVMKFGGTSVEDAASVARVTEIIRARLNLRPVVVVSAMGKTTRKLLQAAETSASGDSRTTLSVVADLKTRHTSEARRLMHNGEGREVFPLIDRYFDELKKLLEGLSILGEVTPRALDKILSYGELLSSVIVAGALKDAGVAAHLLDARQFIKTDDRFGNASPLFDMTNRMTREAVGLAVEQGGVPVVQGFIGSTREGATTTLGFEGSDYTAAIIGAALRADDIQIWKDVSGLMTADPSLFAGAHTVKACSFAEAAELTYFGAKVLHPKAIHPAARLNIPVHIYNSKKPDATGTAIAASAPACTNLIKSVAYKLPVTVVMARALLLDGERVTPVDEFLRSVLDALARRQLAPLLTAISASSVAFALDGAALGSAGERDLIEDLSRTASVESEPGRAIVTLVGEEMRHNPDFVRRAFAALEGLEPAIIMRGPSPITMNLVVAEQDVEETIGRLHRAFFHDLDGQVFE